MGSQLSAIAYTIATPQFKPCMQYRVYARYMTLFFNAHNMYLALLNCCHEHTDHTTLLQLAAELEAWRAMRGTAESDSLLSIELSDNATATAEQQQQQREADGTSVPKTGVDTPKHGKEDEKNEPHVGGNQWAGGTGGSGKYCLTCLT
jgi:hypothetical protein